MEIEKIAALHSLLHLVFHRNKNQHGKTKWWKWLSVLKRSTLKLVESLEHDASHVVHLHRQHLALHVIPQCYLAFSTVVADGQFSTLGTVLLATLARLTRAAGIDKEMKSLNRAKVVNRPSPCTNVLQLEDVGEVISRPREPLATPQGSKSKPGKGNNLDLHGQRNEIEDIAGAATKHPGRKKKGKKKNAIDDIFDGLL